MNLTHGNTLMTKFLFRIFKWSARKCWFKCTYISKRVCVLVGAVPWSLQIYDWTGKGKLKNAMLSRFIWYWIGFHMDIVICLCLNAVPIFPREVIKNMPNYESTAWNQEKYMATWCYGAVPATIGPDNFVLTTNHGENTKIPFQRMSALESTSNHIACHEFTKCSYLKWRYYCEICVDSQCNIWYSLNTWA